MNLIDIVILAILAWGAWRGFSRGLVIEVASLIALLLGIWAALNFSHVAAIYLAKYVDAEGRTLRILSFAVTFIGVVLLVVIIGKILERLVNMVMLGLLNKLLGAVFSMLKFALVLSVIMMVLRIADPNGSLLSPETRGSSYLYPKVEKLLPYVLKAVNYREDWELAEAVRI